MRLPLAPTLVVAVAVVVMIALGLWQLDRRQGKEALLARYAANGDLPPIAFPRPPVGESHLFRRASAMCVEPYGWSREGGRAADGTSGYRHIARCRTGGLEGPGLVVEMGVANDPTVVPQWRGGEVTGTITYAPDPTPLIQRMFGGGAPVRTLMLVSDTPLPGLKPSRTPDPSGIPNNHLAYAVQWFLFAGIAVVIYLLALRRRERKPPRHGEGAQP